MKPEFPLIEQLGLTVWSASPYVRAYDLEELLQKATVVFGINQPNGYWTERRTSEDTHQARVLMVEKVPPPMTPRDRLRHAVDKAVTSAILHRFGIHGASIADQRYMSETIQAVFDEVCE